MSAENETQVLQKSSKCSFLTHRLSSPLSYFLFEMEFHHVARGAQAGLELRSSSFSSLTVGITSLHNHIYCVCGLCVWDHIQGFMYTMHVEENTQRLIM